MKVCQSCNKYIDDGAIFCPNCGARQDGTIFSGGGFDGGYYGAPYRRERPFLYSLLGFFIPIVGFILWIIWRDTRPEASRAALKGAIIGFVANIIVTLLYSYLIYNVGDLSSLEGAAYTYLRLFRF